MKATKILFLSVFLIFLINTVSAVVVYGEWNDNPAQSISIEDGDSVDFSAFFGTIAPPMTISIKLYDSGNDLIHTFEDTEVNQNSFAQTYTINQAIYSMPGDFQVRIFGSDGFGEMSAVLYLKVINYPPVITSDPVTEVNENEFYSYQVVAVDPDNHQLTYSLSDAPGWLLIDSETGLITGTAPDVVQDTDFNIEIVVSDSIDTDTQSYPLTVIWVPNPSLSQTLTLVDDINVGYNAILSELDSAVLEIYYGTELIATRNIDTSSYTETFNFYEIHGITKGDYRFILEAVGYDLSETDYINIEDYAPEVDPIPNENFNEEDSIEITLPVPTDKNPEDNPVAYLSATPDEKVTTFLNGNVLTVEGNMDEIGDYSVELEFGAPNGAKATTILSGYIYNLPDISGVLEDNEEDIGIQGVIHVYYINPNNDSDYLPLEIDKIYEGGIINANLGKIETTSNGTFSFQINERASDLNEIILQARIGEPENYTSYVRTIKINLSDGDDQNVLVRAVPYAPYEDDPVIFRQFMSELCSDQPNTRFDFEGEYLGGINEEFENYTGLEKIRILEHDYFSDGTFTFPQYEFQKNKILDPEDINGLTPNQNWINESYVDIIFGNDPTFTDYTLDNNTQEIVPEKGVIVIVPRSTLGHAGRAETYSKGTLVYKGTIYLTPGAGSDGTVISHEFGHMFIGTGHPVSMPPNQTIMSTSTILQITGPADKKAGQLIYEQTYMTFPLAVFPRIDYLYNILELGFYGESQGTWILSENYFVAEEDEEEDFIGDHQNSNEDSVIGFDNTGSSNGVNADILYDGTIHLQSNTDKNNIITSLSNIIRQVISFISQKLKSIF